MDRRAQRAWRGAEGHVSGDASRRGVTVTSASKKHNASMGKASQGTESFAYVKGVGFVAPDRWREVSEHVAAIKVAADRIAEITGREFARGVLARCAKEVGAGRRAKTGPRSQGRPRFAELMLAACFEGEFCDETVRRLWELEPRAESFHPAQRGRRDRLRNHKDFLWRLRGRVEGGADLARLVLEALAREFEAEVERVRAGDDTGGDGSRDHFAPTILMAVASSQPVPEPLVALMGALLPAIGGTLHRAMMTATAWQAPLDLSPDRVAVFHRACERAFDLLARAFAKRAGVFARNPELAPAVRAAMDSGLQAEIERLEKWGAALRAP